MRRLVLFILLLAAGCQSKNGAVTHFGGSAMTMRYHVVVGGELSPQERDHVQKAIDDTFYLIHQTFNRFNPQSELAKLNRLPAGQKQILSNELTTLLTLTNEMTNQTQGKFDPTVWTVQRLWKEAFEKKELPNSQDLKPFESAVGWHFVHLQDQFFWKEWDLTALDLSGIAKGHGIDLITRALNELGYPDVFVEWGGEIKATGQHPEERPWTIAIAPPFERDLDHILDVVPLNNQGVATSGDYLQYWEIGDEVYTHIFNPLTKKPLKKSEGEIVSVTVCAPTCAMADALATAAMTFPTVEQAKSWAGRFEEATFWVFSRDLSGDRVEQHLLMDKDMIPGRALRD